MSRNNKKIQFGWMPINCQIDNCDGVTYRLMKDGKYVCRKHFEQFRKIVAKAILGGKK